MKVLYRGGFGELRELPSDSTEPSSPAEAVSPLAYEALFPLFEDTEAP